jgi:hypothetical protein
MLLGQLAGELTGGNCLDFCFCGRSHLGFSLLTNQRCARFYGISRKIKGVMVKKTQEIGAFPAYAPEKPEKPGFFEPPKAIGPRERCPRGPIYSCFMRL